MQMMLNHWRYGSFFFWMFFSYRQKDGKLKFTFFFDF